MAKEKKFGTYYVDDNIEDCKLQDNTEYLADNNVHNFTSDYANALSKTFREKIAAGEVLYLVGTLGSTHNSGLSLVKASKENGIEVLSNDEEERFIGIKHYAGYPKLCVERLKEQLSELGLTTKDIFCFCYAWDVTWEERSGMDMLSKNLKVINNEYFEYITKSANPSDDQLELTEEEIAQWQKSFLGHSPMLVNIYNKLLNDLDLDHKVPCVQMLHHENHAYFSYGVSPFAKDLQDNKTTMIACIDGAGDLSSVSLFKAKGSELELVKRLPRANSLGVFYMLLSSLLGGWSALSSEGRYMGAAAWGNNNRLTNPFYKRLRQFFYFSDKGEVHVNSAMTEKKCKLLQEIVGPFVDFKSIWNPDAVLNVDDVSHSSITQQRVDTAAAVQMVFEDALFHIIAFLIEETQSDQLILTGGTALNCVANMRLLDNFDNEYYRRYLNKDTRLNIWVPPIPSDQGVVVGSAYQFAMRNGVTPNGVLPSPFLCGKGPDRASIEQAFGKFDNVDIVEIGNLQDVNTEIADWMAYVVSQDAIVGIFQGESETGPRALGHRSFLSNPCNPKTLESLNSRVKMREKIRPLAPMVTLEAAKKWFKLSDGASAKDYDAYNYMVLTVEAKEEANTVIPAVIHFDQTSRIQIVRKENNLLMHSYLRALNKYIGVEVSVNTSLNVGSPIVQHPEQALDIFNRANGVDCIFMIGEEGSVYMVWAKSGTQKYQSRITGLYAEYVEQLPEGHALKDLKKVDGASICLQMEAAV